MKIKILIIGLLVIGLGVGGFYYYENRTIVTVGDYKIKFKHVKMQEEVMKIFYPESKNINGKEILIKTFTQAQILKNNGAEVTEQKLRSEEMRINQNTRAPETLNKIKAVFGRDEDSYRFIFVLKTYVDRTIYSDFFSRSPKAQQNSLRQVRELTTKLERGRMSFAELAAKEKVRYRKLKISSLQGFQWETVELPGKKVKKDLRGKKESPLKTVPEAEGKQVEGSKSPQAEAPESLKKHLAERERAESNQAVREWVDNIIPKMKVGEVWPEPVDYSSSWLVLKYLQSKVNAKTNDTYYEFDVLEVPKDRFDNWLKAEQGKITIVQ